LFVALAGVLLVCIALPSLAQAQERDCSDFDSQVEAQEALGEGDIERLDEDGDGIVCESPASGVLGG
jgi:hypothetical protein